MFKGLKKASMDKKAPVIQKYLHQKRGKSIDAISTANNKIQIEEDIVNSKTDINGSKLKNSFCSVSRKSKKAKKNKIYFNFRA